MNRYSIVKILGIFSLVYLFLWFFISQPDFRKSQQSVSQLAVQKLEDHVKKLSIDLSPREFKNLENTNKTADYIHEQFSDLKVGVLTEQHYKTENNPTNRIVSLLIGDESAERIIIGAHYDSFGKLPGADDNASGVAGLIEIARIFSKNPTKTALEFVAYPLEEPPFFNSTLMGSWQHANALKNKIPSARYKAMISLEMIGYFSEEKNSQDYPIPLLKMIYPSKGNFISIVGNFKNRTLIRNFKVGMKGSTNLDVYSISAPAFIPGIDFSDHRNYWAHKIPAIMVTDTAFYRNKNYHTKHDTYEKLDYEKMKKVILGVESAVRRISL